MKDEAKPPDSLCRPIRGIISGKVMPFRHENAGSTFRSPWTMLYSWHRKYCRSYIDDVAIYSTTWNMNTLDHIAKVFKSLQEVGLKVNCRKCVPLAENLSVLGHIVGSEKAFSGS
ncbi:retrovirus-related Pol polyprotein from transposon 297 [Trichonephila clavipes]|nr:retrovirus-related Pol polyprotein from transposon 297 [Trichonephila clavipes]